MGGQDESKLPDALGKRFKVVSLSEGGTITVTRWTLAKTMVMASWMTGALKDVTSLKEENMKDFKDKSFMDIAKEFVTVLGDKLPEGLGLAVDPTDRGLVMELPADDAMAVLEAVVDLNITDKLVGKVKGLLGRFKSPEKPAPKST